jgi:hypothetical protein
LRKHLFLVLIIIAAMPLFFFSGHIAALADDVTVGATVNASPLEIVIIAQSSVINGTNFPILAIIRNHSNRKVNNTLAAIKIPGSFRLINCNPQDNIGNISPHWFKIARWQVHAQPEGEYAITISAAGGHSGIVVTAEKDLLIRVVKKPKHYPWGWFD